MRIVMALLLNLDRQVGSRMHFSLEVSHSILHSCVGIFGEFSNSLCCFLKNHQEYQRAGKVPVSNRGNLELHYRDVTPRERAELEAIILQEGTKEEKILEEIECDYDEADNLSEQAHSPPPPYRSNASPESVSAQPPTYKGRRLSNSTIDYVPSFFPDFPGKGKEARPSTSAREADAEFERQRQERLQKGEEKMDLLNEKIETREDQENVAWASLDMAPTSRRSTDDNWYSAVEFSSSTLAQQQSIDDFPESILDDENIEGPKTRTDQEESSHRIFANDYLALISEARSMPPTLLTPNGSGYSNIFNQRRGLASVLSDPSKYVPTDTMFAAIDARPTATPFQPGPSLLITPPTTTDSAPTFTPIQASGRELISTRTINNSLTPICRHRVPNNVLNASRFLSGGENGEIFRRVTRTLDPIPILDERHAERVYHGAQAPKEHLNENNSYLREALDVLKIKRAEETRKGIENGLLEEQESQLSLSTNRDKLRVKSGTLVQTWDWMARDYNDPVPPGKRYRNGTTGVYISSTTASTNEIEQGHGRQRSQSIQFT